MVFHWNSSDSKSPKVYRTLLSILADLNNADVIMVSAPLISMSLLLLVDLFESFSHHHWPMVSHWSLSDSKSPQISRTLLSIQNDLKNAVV